MSIDFQKEKERIELKHSTYIGSIGIYMEFSEKIEDAFFKYYFYDGIREEELSWRGLNRYRRLSACRW